MPDPTPSSCPACGGDDTRTDVLDGRPQARAEILSPLDRCPDPFHSEPACTCDEDNRRTIIDCAIHGQPQPAPDPPSKPYDAAFGPTRATQPTPDPPSPIHGAGQEGRWTICVDNRGRHVWTASRSMENARIVGGEWRYIEVVPLQALEELRAERDEARKRAETAITWLGRVLSLDRPPRNEPAIDDAVKQQAREALGRLRDGD